MYEYRAVIRSIYDADTVRVDVDLGCGVWLKNEPLRLFGINAPEVRGPEREAGARSRDALRERLPVGSQVRIKTHKDKKGKYGRYLAEIIADGIFINDWLVAAGYAERKVY